MIAGLTALALAAAAPGQDRPPAACNAEHAAMGHCTMPAAPTDAPTVPRDPAPAPPPPPVPATWADRVWGADAMRASRAALAREHGGGRFSQVMVDRLEWATGTGRDALAWEVDAWIGGDLDRLWLKTEGQSAFAARTTDATFDALYGRAIGPYFDLQAGLRQDVSPGADPTQLLIGVQGLAPYWFEVEGYVAVSTRGDVRVDVEAEYDQRITQRLILQPRVELAFALQDVPEIGVGSGLSTGEVGVRLRYEIVREFAPYVGVAYGRRFGDTARLSRAAGDGAAETSLLLGVRAWF